MTHLRRLSLLLLPLLFGLACLTGPGRAQTSSSRFAFADTTLLRDTLGLRFDRLFPLADSLGMLPDSLRSLSVRYRWSLERLVHVADSLAIPIDSVGATLERERYNPLAASASNANTFHYTSAYNVQQTSSTWTNGADYGLVRGGIFLRNSTNVSMIRTGSGGRLSLNQSRSSATESGYRLSPRMSLGGRVNLTREDAVDPGSITSIRSSRNEAQFSLRAKQQPRRGVNSDLNLFTGVLDTRDLQSLKRGFSGEANGRVRYSTGSWFSQDFSGQLTGNLSRTRPPAAEAPLNTHDISRQGRGTMTVQPNAQLGLVLNYNLRDIVVEVPTDSGSIQQLKTQNNGIDLTARLRRDNDRYLNILAKTGFNRQLNGQIFGSETRRYDQNAGYSGRYPIAGVTLEHNFSLSRSRSEFPQRDTTGGYGESLYVRSIDATLSRGLGPRVVVMVNGRVSLSSYRYFLLGHFRTPPTSHDQYTQSYRAEMRYTRSERVNSALVFEVTRNLFLNLPAASTAANNEDKVYRGEWRWSYRLLPGLTATQRNQISADYSVYSVLPANDRLALNYSANTTLNAVLSPRLTLDVTHNSLVQPTGSYVRQFDGFEALALTDQSQNYTLLAHITYTPTSAVSFVLEPNYQASNRSTTANGATVPIRQNRTLNFSGGASLNIPLGVRGKIVGDIRRSYRADRSIGYSLGVPQPAPRSETDFWNGSLQLSWDL